MEQSPNFTASLPRVSLSDFKSNLRLISSGQHFIYIFTWYVYMYLGFGSLFFYTCYYFEFFRLSMTVRPLDLSV